MFDWMDSMRTAQRARASWCRAFVLLALVLAIGSGARAQSVDELTIITENYPPYNFNKDGELRGMAVDLMVEMLKRNGSARGASPPGRSPATTHPALAGLSPCVERRTFQGRLNL